MGGDSLRVCGIVCVFYLAVVRLVRCSDRSSGIGYLVNVILIVVSGVIGWINCVKRSQQRSNHSDKKSSSVKKRLVESKNIYLCHYHCMK